MVQTTAPFTDLRLRALAMSSRGKGDTMAVMVFAEPEDRSVKLNALSVGVFDPSGKGSTTAAQSQQLGTFPIAIPLATVAGPHRIRVAAVDANGRAGAVDIAIDTTLISVTPTLRLGSLVLAAPRPDGSFAPQMQFSDEPQIVAYVEMYGLPSADQSARIELADADEGKALKTIEPSGGATAEPDKFILSGQVPMADLKPGDYVVRVIVETKGQPDVVVKRTFRKVAK
jgi:hypothetical protein